MYPNPFSLKNKLVLITGASSGIGRQCAIGCSRMGASTILLGRNNNRLKETQRLIGDANHSTTISIDLLEYTLVENAIAEMVKKKGRIDGLINCAGISTTLPLKNITNKQMDYFFKTNVYAALNLTQQVLKKSCFSEQGGSIVFISSIMGLRGEKGKTLYSMTKAAIIAAVRSMALELSQRNVRVNAISPGVVITPMSEGAIYSTNDERLNRIKEAHPLGLGHPDDVANASVYLLSDASKWITGSNLIVDGGYTAK